MNNNQQKKRIRKLYLKLIFAAVGGFALGTAIGYIPNERTRLIVWAVLLSCAMVYLTILQFQLRKNIKEMQHHVQEFNRNLDKYKALAGEEIKKDISEN